ncbi:MAG: type VI secretion system ATPase TssH, partial [Clostridia bacterium]|nr:type VI secretion system ATPase TssH [Clostridia bacterium]
RLDEIVYFRALTPENMKGIVELQLRDLAKRMEARRLELSVTEAAKQAIIDNGSDPLFGARPIKRFIQGRIESLIARFIIAESPEEGATVTVDHDGTDFIVS